MNKLSIRDLELGGKRVFIRVDFNVPLDGGRVTDDTRIRETLPTLAFARARGARLVLASHLGRPKGKPDPKYSLRPVAAKLAELLGAPVEFAADCVGADAEARSRALANGGVLLLENVRYHAEEEANDESFSASTGGAVRRPVCVRCVRLGAPRARIGRGNHALREAGRGRTADGARAGVSGQGAVRIPSGHSWPCWAAQKFPTRSKWSRT